MFTNGMYADLGSRMLPAGPLSFVFWGRIDGVSRCMRFFDWGVANIAGEVYFTPSCASAGMYTFNTPVSSVVTNYAITYAWRVGALRTDSFFRWRVALLRKRCARRQ